MLTLPRVAAVALMLVSTTGTRGLAAQSTEERAVRAAVEQLFSGMRTRDTAAVRAVFEPGARLVGIRTPASGSPRLQSISVDQWVAAIGRDTRGVWNERAFEPKVFVDGTMATVWAAYDFRFDDKPTSCGTDSVQLLKIADAWKIVSIADTYRTTGCPDRGSVNDKKQ